MHGPDLTRLFCRFDLTVFGSKCKVCGKSHTGRPGVYFHVDARSMGIASGYYNPEPAQVRSIRTHICTHLDEFANLLEDPEFKELFGTIAGEKGKVLQAEFREAAASQSILFNKQFY